MPIVASYNGAAPGDATATPNYQLKIELTNLSVYGLYEQSSGGTVGPELAWEEMTAGHLATSPSVTLNTVSTVAERAWVYDASKYIQLAWDPGDYSLSLGALNDSVTRSFEVNNNVVGDYRLLEGIEVSGRVVLSYNAVPEPSAVVLLATGLIGLLCYAWKKRK